jgi:ketosteroid isomerase-like protein
VSDREVSHEETIRRVIRQLNDLWLSKQYDGIAELISAQVVVAPPGFNGRIRGREAYVRSFREFDRAATTHEFSPGEPEIDIVGDVAVAICPFFIVYEMAGTTHRDRGRDILVFSRSTGEWRVVWRTMLSESAE